MQVNKDFVINLKRSHQIFSVLLAAFMLLLSFKNTFIYIDFKIHQDYIAKNLCVNRFSPDVMCGGSCYLQEQMEQNDIGDYTEHAVPKFEDISPFKLQLKPVQLLGHSIFSSQLLGTPINDTFLWKAPNLDNVFHPPIIIS